MIEALVMAVFGLVAYVIMPRDDAKEYLKNLRNKE